MPKEKGRLLLVRVVMDGHTHNEMNAEGRQVLFSLSSLFVNKICIHIRVFKYMHTRSAQCVCVDYYTSVLDAARGYIPF
jgi:hypothetical protein